MKTVLTDERFRRRKHNTSGPGKHNIFQRPLPIKPQRVVFQAFSDQHGTNVFVRTRKTRSVGRLINRPAFVHTTDTIAPSGSDEPCAAGSFNLTGSSSIATSVTRHARVCTRRHLSFREYRPFVANGSFTARATTSRIRTHLPPRGYQINRRAPRKKYRFRRIVFERTTRR